MLGSNLSTMRVYDAMGGQRKKTPLTYTPIHRIGNQGEKPYAEACFGETIMSAVVQPSYAFRP